MANKHDISQARNKRLYPGVTALLLVDVQKSEIEQGKQIELPEYARAVSETALPNIQRLVQLARDLGIEVIFTVIESMTQDGRDRSLDHKISGIHFPRGSELAEVIDLVAPLGDEMVFKKTSSGVFNSTSLDYVLRNLNIENLIVVGFLTDQCVDMAIRDGADKGYYVVCPEDACATHTPERHQNAIAAFGGYCLVTQTRHLIEQLMVAAGE